MSMWRVPEDEWMGGSPFAVVRKDEFLSLSAGEGCVIIVRGSGHVSIVGEPMFNIFAKKDEEQGSVLLFHCPLCCLGVWEEKMI